MSETRILAGVKSPDDLNGMTMEELKQLSDEIRARIIEVVTATGGHFGGPLGAVELTVALHHVFDSPKDVMIWDVGHQAYAHKILTGRNEKFESLRQYGGISGFLKRSESEHDVFGAGHASTSISSAIGFAKARDYKGEDNAVIAIIGDGGMSGGLAFEALNNAGQLKTDLLVILNDNEMSISPNVGAMSQLFTRIATNPLYNRIRDDIWDLTGKLPIGKKQLRFIARRFDEGLKALISPGIFFEELGIRYFGPIHGNDLQELVPTLRKLKSIKGPILLHVLSRKGKGYEPAEIDPVKWHGIGGRSKGETKQAPDYLEVFGNTAIELAEKDDKVCLITAAMKEGTGLVEYAEKFPDRFFDVGIAEAHAVTFAAGLAASGMRPVAAIYSTFLQRAFDQLVHDVALQNLPVIFALDRAGLVGPDGPTHHGSFDLSYLSAIPNMTVAAPKDGDELRNLLHTALAHAQGPFAVRYPKDCSISFDPGKPVELIRVGSWEELAEGEELTFLAVGSMVEASMKARDILLEDGIFAGVVNCRFIKPFDEDMMRELSAGYGRLVTVEENTISGGFGTNLRRWCAEENLAGFEMTNKALADGFSAHGPRDMLLDDEGLSPRKLALSALEILGKRRKKRKRKEVVR